jgi:hypothetical protein
MTALVPEVAVRPAADVHIGRSAHPRGTASGAPIAVVNSGAWRANRDVHIHGAKRIAVSAYASVALTVPNTLSPVAGASVRGYAVSRGDFSVTVRADSPQTAATDLALKGKKMSLKEKLHHLLMGASLITSMSGPRVPSRTEAQKSEAAHRKVEGYLKQAEDRLAR